MGFSRKRQNCIKSIRPSPESGSVNKGSEHAERRSYSSWFFGIVPRRNGPLQDLRALHGSESSLTIPETPNHHTVLKFTSRIFRKQHRCPHHFPCSPLPPTRGFCTIAPTHLSHHTSFSFLFLLFLLILLLNLGSVLAYSQVVTWNGYSYKYFSSSLNWDDAEAACIALNPGGHLVSILSANENSLLASNGYNGWIGTKVSMTTWTDTNAKSYENYNQNEPNNQGGVEDCLELSGAGWNDLQCSSARPYTCETPVACWGVLATASGVCAGHGSCSSEDECTCDARYYPELNVGCVECPEGHYCPGGSDVETALITCPDGEWSIQGADSSFLCAPDNCLQNYACKDGVKTSCIGSQPALYPKNNLYGNSRCGVCDMEGYYLSTVGDITSCSMCPMGSSCPGDGGKYPCMNSQYADEEGMSVCLTCPPGYFTSYGNMACLECGVGEFCPDGIQRISCSNGSVYYDSNLNQCALCPEGSICKDGIREDCPPGYYVQILYSRDDALCLPCPAGFACSGDGTRTRCINEYFAEDMRQSTCQLCNPGYYTDNSTLYCRECPANSYCATGIYPIYCPPGYYLPKDVPTDSLTCQICPLGHFCLDFEKFICVPGSFANETGSHECNACPAGTWNDKTGSTSAADCRLCPEGWFSGKEGSSSCSGACPVGTYSISRGAISIDACIKCPKGHYQNDVAQSNSSACKPCPPGYHSPNEGSSRCDPCDLGSHALEEGSYECKLCQAGYFANETALPECFPCFPGSYNEDTGSTSEDACILCPNGGSFVYGANSSDVCLDCFPGYRVEGKACIACDLGTYSDVYDANTCTPCPSGTFSDSIAASSVEECRKCPPGSWQPSQGMSSCLECEPGTFQPLNGSSTPCLICSPGYYSLEKSGECIACAPGSYADAEASECTLCPRGHFQPNSTASQCLPCPPGTFSSTEGSLNCTLCPLGTYNSIEASISISNCTFCDIGTFSSIVGATSKSQCTLCPAGAFCDEQALSKPKKCRMGTYSTVEGAIGLDTCIECPPGSFSGQDGASSPSTCESCPTGRWSSIEGAVSLDQCEYCPGGTSSDELYATDYSFCQPCGPGTYATPGSSSCLSCPTGTYNVKNQSSSVDDCIACPPGKTTLQSGSTSPQDCFSCPQGYYISIAGCTPCPSGSYFDQEAQPEGQIKTIQSCISCGKGYYQPREAQVGFESCTSCPAGSYGPLTKNSECIACGKGYWLSEMAATSHASCHACPPGTWSEEIMSTTVETCLKCPPGTSSNISAASSSNACKPCPQLYKSEREGASECLPCSFPTACSSVGNSMESELLQELLLGMSIDTSIHNPKSTDGGNLSSVWYTTLKIAVPLLLLIGLLMCSCCGLVFSVGAPHALRSKKIYTKGDDSREEATSTSFPLLKKVDIFFSKRHFVPKGSSPTHTPSALGGTLSILLLIGFLVFVSSVLIDFFGANRMVLEKFQVEQSKGATGDFLFETAVSGQHESCNVSVNPIGFQFDTFDCKCAQGEENPAVQDARWQKVRSHLNRFRIVLLNACRCECFCHNCKVEGQSSRLLFDFGTQHMMSQLILFSIHVPYYFESTWYSIQGRMSSGNSIFTGNEKPNVFSFSLNKAKYISTSFFAPVLSAFGLESTDVKKGYTVDATGKSLGSIQPLAVEEFAVDRGMIVEFDIQEAYGTYISKEEVKQNVIVLLTQMLTIVSMLASVYGLCLKLYERLQIWKSGTQQIVPLKYDFGEIEHVSKDDQGM